MQPFVSPLPNELNAEQAKLYASITSGKRTTGTQHFPITDSDGRLHGPFGLMLLHPAFGAALQELGSTIRFHGDLTPREREIAILTVGAITASDFEVWAHERVALGVGLSAHEISSLLSGTFESQDRREQICSSFSKLLLSGNQLSDSDRAPAKIALGSKALYELTVLVGYYFTLSRTMSVFDVGVPEEN